jgi:type IV pilus assembly protein PilA
MKRHIQQGFTLIELMIVVAIVGVPATMALPTYQDYTNRAKITEGASIGSDAENPVTWGSPTLADLNATADSWNLQAGGAGATGKSVTSVQVARATGIITITYDAYNAGSIPAASTIAMDPYIRSGGATTQLGASYAAALTGMIDWGCAGEKRHLRGTRRCDAGRHVADKVRSGRMLLVASYARPKEARRPLSHCCERFVR